MRVEIASKEVPYRYLTPTGKILFQIDEATLRHERFRGGMSEEMTRVNFERGDGVAVLPYARETDEVVLIEQFRYPAWASQSEPDSAERGWLLETIAGIKDADGADVARVVE